MGDANPIRTLIDYSKPSHEGYRNTIELPEGNNVVPLRSDTFRLVQNGCSFHGLRSEDPNQHLKDFLKLVDSLDLDARSISGGSYYSFPCSIVSTGRTAKLHNDILMFQQHQGESLSESWTRFKDLLQKVPHHGIDLWLQVPIFYDHITPATRRTIDQLAGGKLHDRNAKESWALLEDLILYDSESWNDPRDFAKPVKAISLPQDVPSTSDRLLIKLEHQVQRLMEAYIAPMQPTQVNKITSSCEICSGPHDTKYCMENLEQAFVEYASSRTDKVGGLVSNFMASQDARLSKFEADFKQQQSEMTNKIDTVLKAITDQMAEALPSDMVKNLKLNVNSTSLVLNDEEMGIEWLDIEEPLDLVDTSEESVYESLIKEMPKCSLNYDFKIKKGDLKNLKIPCMIGHKFTANAYIDVDLPMNIMSLSYYNSIRKSGYKYRGRNFLGLGRDMHVYVGNMSYVMDFTILENIETNIDPSLSHVVSGRPFVEIVRLVINRKHGLMTFMDGTKEIPF
ncbi:hypothetical protein Tco_0959229 [Tanacetum coccineum]